MSGDLTICLGTLSSGVFQSSDAGKSWVQARLEMPVPPWSPWIEARGVAVSPHNPAEFLAGSNVGLHRSFDGGRSWSFVPFPARHVQVWAVAYHPTDPQRLYAGLAPLETDLQMLRSEDGGKTWLSSPIPFPARTVFGATHVTSFAFDPENPEIMYASVEVAGLFRSEDGGRTWLAMPLFGEGTNNDIHCVTVLADGRILASTPDGIWSRDKGADHFTLHRFDPFPEREAFAVTYNITGYARGIAVKPDEPDVVLLGIGDYTPGRFGAIKRSTDGGRTWMDTVLSHEPNSHFYTLAYSRANPAVAVAVTMYGYVYVSQDGGTSWEKTAREFGEVRGLAVSLLPA